MKFILVLAFIVAAAMAAPAPEQTVSVLQNTAGTYKIDINTNDQSRFEERSLDGSVVGSYKWIDAAGIERKVDYVSGAEGFRVTNLADIQ